MRDERPGGEETQAARLGGDVEAGATQRSTRYERRQPDDGQVEPRTRRLVPDLTDQTHRQTDTCHVVPHTHTCHTRRGLHSDMVYDPEYTTGLYQREAQTLWIVTSSSECYI